MPLACVEGTAANEQMPAGVELIILADDPGSATDLIISARQGGIRCWTAQPLTRCFYHTDCQGGV